MIDEILMNTLGLHNMLLLCHVKMCFKLVSHRVTPFSKF